MKRWLLWWRCRECGEVLKQHQPDYAKRQRLQCPVARRDFPARHGFDKEWRRHIWGQGLLLRHECDCLQEAPAA